MNREFIEYLSARKNETLAVATILFTRGSTPRKAGTSMVVFPDGSIFGTIGLKHKIFKSITIEKSYLIIVYKFTVLLK